MPIKAWSGIYWNHDDGRGGGGGTATFYYRVQEPPQENVETRDIKGAFQCI